MNSRIFPKPYLTGVDIRIYAIAISCLLSLYTILTTPVLNDDAYGYLRAAELFSEEGVRTVLDNYGWYGYSILIAIMDLLFPGGLQSAAHLINTVMYALLVWSFITLSTEFRNSDKVKIFSCLLILSYVQINEMRALLIRDFGFWAFCLLALLMQIRFHKQGRLIYAAGWCLSIFAAIFFRLEGVILLLLTPLAIFLDARPHRDQLKTWLIMQTFVFGTAVLTLLICLSAGINLIDLFQYAYRYYLPNLLNPDGLIIDTVSQLNQAIFSPHNFPGFSGHGLVILIFAYLYAVCANMLLALGIPQSLLLCYGLIRRDIQPSSQALTPALFFIAGSIMSLLAFITIMHFLTQRYAVMACLIILSLLPLTLENLYERLSSRGQLKTFSRVFGFLIFYFMADTLTSFGPSKDYLRDAASWLENEIPSGSTLYTNEYSIAYYSGLITEYDKISQQALDYSGMFDSGDILAVNIGRNDSQLRNIVDRNTNLIHITGFENSDGDRAEIFRYR